MNQNKTSNLDFVVFDFDGVLVDSLKTKELAFLNAAEMFEPRFAEVFATYHRLNGGVSRQEKCKYFVESLMKITNESESESLVCKMVEQVERYLDLNQLKMNLTVGAKEFLCFLKQRNVDCSIVSAAPQVEVETLCNAHNVIEYFNQILGAPTSKSENLKRLLLNGKITGRGFYIGDSLVDFEIASKYKLPFIYMRDYSSWTPSQSHKKEMYMIVNNLKELNEVLSESE